MKIKLCFSILFILVFFMFVSCGHNDFNEIADIEKTDADLTLQWIDTVSSDKSFTPSFFVPDEINKIVITISGSGMNDVTHTYSADEKHGFFPLIPVGDDRTVLVKALSEGDTVLFKGYNYNVNFDSNRRTYITVRMYKMPAAPVFTEVVYNEDTGLQFNWLGDNFSESFNLIQSYSEDFAVSDTIYQGSDTSFLITDVDTGTYYFKLNSQRTVPITDNSTGLYDNNSTFYSDWSSVVSISIFDDTSGANIIIDYWEIAYPIEIEIEMILVEPETENPHGVTEPYYIGKYPVTNEEYATVLNWAYSQNKIDNSHTYPDRISWNSTKFEYEVETNYELHPVTSVSYNDAGIWCNLLSEMEGLTPSFAGVSANPSGNFDTTVNGYRLPEDEEWTYAAIGLNAENPDNSNEDWYYPWESPNDSLPQRMNYWESNDPWESDWPRTTPVGFFNGTTHQKSFWNWIGTMETFETISNASYAGAYDMAGNVWEWTGGQLSGSYRVLRGGSWSSLAGPLYCRVAYRGSYSPSSRSVSFGFRVFRTAP